MENIEKLGEMTTNKDIEALMLDIIHSTYVKKEMKFIWNKGRGFKMEDYKLRKLRTLDDNVDDIPDSALNFEELWDKYYLNKSI